MKEINYNVNWNKYEVYKILEENNILFPFLIMSDNNIHFILFSELRLSFML